MARNIVHPLRRRSTQQKVSEEVLEIIADEIPHGIPDEPLPSKKRHRAVGSQLPDYGFKTWAHLFTTRQLLASMTFVKWTRMAKREMENAWVFSRMDGMQLKCIWQLTSIGSLVLIRQSAGGLLIWKRWHRPMRGLHCQ